MSVSTLRQVEPRRETPDAAQLVSDLSGLVSPPVVCVKMFELVQSARASAEEIGAVVALDPNLAVRLLRIVNSSFYGFPARIDTIARAVTILGTSDLYNLVLAISAVRSFDKVSDGLVRMETFWHHSIFCALLARQLARQCRIPEPDRLFVAGLLHDIGTCVTYSQLGDCVPAMRVVVLQGEAALHAAERERFGFSHADVGALVLEQWQLPIELQDAIRHHHSPAEATVGPAEAAVVHLADALANQSGVGALSSSEMGTVAIDDAVWDALGPDSRSINTQQLVAEVSAVFGETLQNLMPAKRR